MDEDKLHPCLQPEHQPRHTYQQRLTSQRKAGNTSPVTESRIDRRSLLQIQVCPIMSAESSLIMPHKKQAGDSLRIHNWYIRTPQATSFMCSYANADSGLQTIAVQQPIWLLHRPLMQTTILFLPISAPTKQDCAAYSFQSSNM